jgi:hypothetical protein
MSILSGSLRNGTFQSKPIMDLVYECAIYRSSSSYTGAGSLRLSYALLPGITPCDVSPLTDMTRFLEAGQTEVITHSVHLPAGTIVQTRDAIKILSSRTGFGPIGITFFVSDVLLPSESISYVRCHATVGKEPTTGAV